MKANILVGMHDEELGVVLLLKYHFFLLIMQNICNN